jgi:NitT/TauT family transport system ATP-binding protein
MQVLVEGVRKVWNPGTDQETVALETTHHAFPSARFSCLLGPSGCGKSTLIQIVGGLERPSDGRVRIVDPAHPGAAQPIGTHSVMMWQGLNLFPWRSVIDNVAFGLEMAGMARPERHARARALLELVGLTGFEAHMPRQLSGGMRQRVALARALILERPILLMDEPFGALDAQTKIIMQEELIRIFESAPQTILFVTHAIEEAILLGDQVIVMTARPGRIKAVIDIDLPRPRSLALVKTKRFGELFDQAFQLLRAEVMTSMRQQALIAGG